MKVIVPIVLLCICIGCASQSSPKTEATSRMKPVEQALAAYHHDTGDYPAELADLRGRYIEPGIAFDDSDVRHIWHILYTRRGKDSYTLQYYTPPCSAAFCTNGQSVAYYGPAFK